MAMSSVTGVFRRVIRRIHWARVLAGVVVLATLLQPLNADVILRAASHDGSPTAGVLSGEARRASGIYYSQLMRELSSLRSNLVSAPHVANPQSSPPTALFSSPSGVSGVDSPQKLEEKLRVFTESQRERLEELGVSGAKQRKFFDLLEKSRTTDVIASEAKQSFKGGEIRLSKPSAFKRSDVPIRIQTIKKARLRGLPGQTFMSEKGLQEGNSKDTAPKESVFKKLLNYFTISTAKAVAPEYLPALEDLRGSGGEISLGPEIRTLADSLERNPVKILNFLRENISYAPYYGSKKGAIGCLREKICNDADAAALAVSLLRASNIPAKYRRAFVTFRISQLKKLLGVEDAKTVFVGLAQSDVPVFVMNPALDNVAIDEADFSQEREFLVEWIFPEFFYEYDQRQANFSNGAEESEGVICDFSVPDLSIEAFHACLNESPKKQWIPLEGLIRPYTATHRDILSGLNFSVEDFWNRYFTYNGPLPVVDKFFAEVEETSGRRATDFTSTHIKQARRPLEGISMTPPYKVMDVIADDNGNLVPASEWFSQMPEVLKHSVSISLAREDGTAIFQKTFAAHEINNTPISLEYEGATEVNRAVIEDFGGISQTPPSLVDIVPVLTSGGQEYRGIEGAEGVVLTSIGEPLVLSFLYTMIGGAPEETQKISLAGNNEGIYLSFGAIPDEPLVDDSENSNRNSHILLGGEAEIARQYLRRVMADGKRLAASLDHTVEFKLARAVVTQTRLTREVDNFPTTFDFKGLTIDSSFLINDFNNGAQAVGQPPAFKKHHDDFWNLHVQNASQWENRIFEEIAGLESVSTVKGIQYATAHPETYTIHRITAENAAEIDTLNLSENTKQNMRDAIARGGWVLTPDRPVQMGAWRGVVYIAKESNEARYAIGEQAVANGGYTAVDFLLDAYDDEGGKTQDYATVLVACTTCDFIVRPRETIENGIEWVQEQVREARKVFIYQEDRLVGSKLCSMAETPYYSLLNALDANGRRLWDVTHGVPCLYEEFSFGVVKNAPTSVTHKALLATNAVKFYSPGRYNRWTYLDDVVVAFNAKYPGGNLTLQDLDWNFGTYKKDADGEVNNSMGVYDPASQRVYEVSGPIQTRYYISRTKIGDRVTQEVLGFPAGDQEIASAHNGNGSYRQRFTAGSIYHPWYTNAFAVAGEMDEAYRGGASQRVGFPHEQPILQNGNLVQRFRSGEMRWDLAANEVAVSEIFNHKYACADYRSLKESDSRYYFVMADGAVDGLYEFADGVYDGLWALGSAVWWAVWHPLKAGAEVIELADELTQLELDQVVVFLDSLPNALTADFRSAQCNVQTAYEYGRLVGKAAVMLVPAEITLSQKIRAIRWGKRFEAAGAVGEWLAYVDEIKADLRVIKSRQGIGDVFPLKRMEHTILGDFDHKGNFIGGLHSPRTFKTAMEKGIIEVWSIDEKNRYLNFKDIPMEANGVRRAKILNRHGEKKYKSLFPEPWADEDIISGIMEADANGGTAAVMRNGVTVQVKARRQRNQTYIGTGEPD